MKKIIFAVLIICVIVASVPWIWLESTYGLTNIPHYNLTMWIFMELYGILLLLILAGVLLVSSALIGEEEPERRERKLRVKQSEEPKTEEEAPDELQEDVVEDGSYTDPPVEYPAVWDKEDFE